MSEQPFSATAYVPGTYTRIVPTIDEPMVTMLLRIIKLASCVSVPAGFRELAQVKQT